MPPRRRSRGKGATRQTKKGGVEKREAIKSKKVVVDDDVGVDVKEHGKQRGVGQREAESLAPSPSSPPKYNPTSSELEKKRLQVADELRKVEQQIYDLETKYLESSSAFGNAVRGYEGFLGGQAQANRKVIVRQEDRLFSSSSSTYNVPGTLLPARGQPAS